MKIKIIFQITLIVAMGICGCANNSVTLPKQPPINCTSEIKSKLDKDEAVKAINNNLSEAHISSIQNDIKEKLLDDLDLSELNIDYKGNIAELINSKLEIAVKNAVPSYLYTNHTSRTVDNYYTRSMMYSVDIDKSSNNASGKINGSLIVSDSYNLLCTGNFRITFAIDYSVDSAGKLKLTFDITNVSMENAKMSALSVAKYDFKYQGLIPVVNNLCTTISHDINIELAEVRGPIISRVSNKLREDIAAQEQVEKLKLEEIAAQERKRHADYKAEQAALSKDDGKMGMLYARAEACNLAYGELAEKYASATKLNDIYRAAIIAGALNGSRQAQKSTLVANKIYCEDVKKQIEQALKKYSTN